MIYANEDEYAGYIQVSEIYSIHEERWTHIYLMSQSKNAGAGWARALVGPNWNLKIA